MRGNPNIKPIEAECKEFEKKLNILQYTLDEWIKCQKVWMYLEPIFSSEDIIVQMPTEAIRFNWVNTLWRSTMEATKKDPSAFEVMEKDLLTQFEVANKKLDDIQKGLKSYLEVKRLAFPRFFFLSDDELLQILAQTKDPKAVQPHMSKIFEAIQEVEFDENLCIVSMV